MQTFIQNLSTVLEIANWIGGILIAIFAFKGLQQLKIAKDTIAISSKRDAFKLTADEVSLYLNHVIPLFDALDERIKNEKITFFAEAEVKINEKEIGVNFPKGEKHIMDLISIAGEIVKLLNALESFAIYFISGVASEELAFTSVGTTYCSSVKKILPVIVLLNDNKKNYKNLLKLFYLWNSRLEKLDLLNNKKAIEKKLKSLSDTSITPIGVK